MACQTRNCRGRRAPSAAASFEDEEPDQGPDRDDLSARYASRKAVGREHMASLMPGGDGNRAWGGALRRMAVGGVGPSREDEHRLVSVPGRYVPIGFARYVDPVVDPYEYEFYRISGWRVAVPRAIPGWRVRDLLYRIFWFGPQSAGYLRAGDTLVPAILSPGDRMTIGQAALEYETAPLGP
jgi:hypothetical protein